MVRKNIPVNKNQRDLLTSGGRLGAERERVGLTVQDFALRCGVTKQTQIKYEANQNSPDIRYLEGCDGCGVDVMYVLTGARSTEAMPDEHQNLIEAYEAASDDLKRAAFAVLLSPWKKGYLDKPMKEPGYFQHQILGEDDLRYEKFKVPEKWGGSSPQSSSDEAEDTADHSK